MCEARTEAKTKTDEIISSLNRLADVLERLLGSGASNEFRRAELDLAFPVASREELEERLRK